MSKEDVCKVTSATKHKERKPKKPHYIPRPWGKPYNYKCFQCPFTCMEKSHLYNHMKYSLCKNSLSLLIESDWPYKKGNILHPEQLRPLQQAHGLHAAAKDETEQAVHVEEKLGQQRRGQDDGEPREARREEEGEEEQVEVSGLTKIDSNGGRGEPAEGSGRCTEPLSEHMMTDMLSLEEQLLRARSAEVEAHFRHQKLQKTCLSTPGLLPEQWRLLASSHIKSKAESTPARVNASIPCYPPPPSLVDYQDPCGLNLSMFGVGYPINPGLFSYVNSALPTPQSGMGSQTHAQLTQLPFLASAAQLIHPASGAHTDRAVLPSRFFYPFLCEHALGGQSDTGKSLKSATSALDVSPMSGFQPKVNLWKVPALMPGSTLSSAGWVSPQRDSPNPGCRLEEKMPTGLKESKAGCNLKRLGAVMRAPDTPPEKKSAAAFAASLLRNMQTATTDKLLLQNSLQEVQLQARSSEPWSYNPHSENLFHSPAGKLPDAQVSTASRMQEEASESVAALLTDLSKALQEYHEAEHKITHLEKEDLTAQQLLWEHLGKIRSELSHIHQALERTAGQSDGPLDLSVKKESTELVSERTAEEDDGLKDETEEEEEDGEEMDEKKKEEGESKSETMKATLESRKQSLDLLIKMSHAAAVSTDVLSAGGLALRPTEALWPSRTTKCEADSSVLLCPDGRSVMFTDVPKPQKRPPSIQRLESQCPLSPLTTPDF